MVISSIFEIVRDSLLSVQYEGNENDEFERIFDLWKEDVEYLFNFFEEHKADLQGGFFGDISVEDAVYLTIEEATEFERYIREIAEEGIHNPDASLDVLVFRPLHDNETSTKRVQSKAYGSEDNSWLRIYAIRLGNNQYIVTGGAIKLTKAMQDRPHTDLELKKLKTVSTYLKDEGIIDGDDIGFLDITTK